MKNNQWLAFPIFALIAVLLILLYRGAKTQDTPIKIEPAKVESIPGKELKRITLTEKAAQRLDIETVSVSEQFINNSGSVQKVVPYASVIYDTGGKTWVYINPKPLVFIREPIQIDYIDGNLAILLKSPPIGTKVVTVGVAELYGLDTGIGK